MPIETHIDQARRRVCVKLWGDFTFEDMRAAISGAAHAAEFEPGFDVLSDHTEIGRAITIPESKELLALMRSLAGRFAGSRWAIVTRRLDSFGMLRLISAHAESVPIEMQVFRDFAEAEAWLAGKAAP